MLLLSLGPMSATASAVETGTTTVTNNYGGIKRGTFSHIDDGDHFSVCDLNPDGHGVSGTLLKREPITGDYSIKKSQSDGGDAGCDSFTFNIIVGDTYIMRVCYLVFSDDCKDLTIIE